MKKLFLLIVLVLFTSLFNGEVIDRVIARVNDQIITDFDIRLLMFMQKNKMSYSDILQKLIDEDLIIASAKDMDYKIQDEQVNYNVDQTIANQRARYGSDSLFLAALKNEGMTLSSLKENYRKQIKNSMLKENILEDKVKKKISITTDEVQKYYNDHKDEFIKTPKTFSIQTAYISAIDFNKMKYIYKNITRGRKVPSFVISKKFKKLYKNLLSDEFQKLLAKNKKYSNYIINENGMNFYKILKWDNKYPSVIFYTIPFVTTNRSFANAERTVKKYITQIGQGANFGNIKTKSNMDYETIFKDGDITLKELPKQYKEKFNSAKKNGIFYVKVLKGFYIIKVNNISDIEYSKLGKSFDEIYKKIYAIKYKELYDDLIKSAKKENYVKEYK